MKELHYKVYQDYKISIPIEIKKLQDISSGDELMFEINKNNEFTFNKVAQELKSIQDDLSKFFGNRSLVEDFLAQKNGSYFE